MPCRPWKLSAYRAAVASALAAVMCAAGVTQASVARPLSGASVAGAQVATTTTAPRPYLVLGDSISAGYQPGRGDVRTGGYAGAVAAGLARRGTPVRITNLACTGESLTTMRTGTHCRYRAGSQQAAALAFLRAHPDTALVTISLGGNDLLRCASGRGRSVQVDRACAQRAASNLRPRFASILGELRRAAPNARVVVLDYYDPFQAAYLRGSSIRVAGSLSSLMRTRVNTAVHGAARDAGARIAYVVEPFDDGWARRVELPGHGRVPIKVARICTWTWMCSRDDVHPNDEGYRVIAGAVLTSLTRRR